MYFTILRQVGLRHARPHTLLHIIVVCLKPATGCPCVPVLPRNSRQLENASTHMLSFCGLRWLLNNRCVSDQLGALGRQHFHGNRRLNAGVEHVLLEQLTFFERMHCSRRRRHTHRSPLHRCIKAQTKHRRWYGARNYKRMNARSTCGRLFVCGYSQGSCLRGSVRLRMVVNVSV